MDTCIGERKFTNLLVTKIYEQIDTFDRLLKLGYSQLSVSEIKGNTKYMTAAWRRGRFAGAMIAYYYARNVSRAAITKFNFDVGTYESYFFSIL